MNLSEHFTLAELCFSSTAQRLGIDNVPPSEVIDRLSRLARGLEQIRALLGGYPLHIDSGYRCPKLNAAVRGAPKSAHMDGDAADFTCAQYGTPLQIVRAVQASGLAYDQIIQEGTWVHVSFAPAMRGQVLTAHFGACGRVTYSEGC